MPRKAKPKATPTPAPETITEDETPTEPVNPHPRVSVNAFNRYAVVTIYCHTTAQADALQTPPTASGLPGALRSEYTLAQDFRTWRWTVYTSGRGIDIAHALQARAHKHIEARL